MTTTDNETNVSEDELFARKAKAVFEQSVDGLDGRTQSRLNQARQAALAQIDTRTVSTGRWTQWAPAAGAAAVAVVAVVLWNGNPQIDAGTLSPNGDFEIILAQESFDMLQDLEFYSWVDIDAKLEVGPGVDADVG